MRKLSSLGLFTGAVLVAACGGDGKGDLFPPKPECQGDAVVAYMGTQPQVISTLTVGSASDGFDLDGDGDPDNKLASVASVAKGGIADALDNYSLIIPIEFFSLEGAGADDCVKFAIYLGQYVPDVDMDGKKPLIEKGDCNDHDKLIGPDVTEVADNNVDDDCDGKADEDAQNVASTDTVDHDGDGFSKAQGDCDDRPTLGTTIHPGAAEVCGDGLDNDCDGVADRTANASGLPACSPFDPAHPVDMTLDPRSFENGQPAIAFKDGTIGADGKLLAGPSLFSVKIPVTGDLVLDLRITGATIKADVVQAGDVITLKNGHLGGVIDSKTADTIRGLTVDQIGLKPEDSLLDATFANLLGPLLALPKADKKITAKYADCRTPDIDVDNDGLEAFCDSDLNDDFKVVDTCIDGDGTEIKDVVGADGAVIMNCSEALKDGKPRFVDGISVELNFETTQLKSILPPPT